MRRVLRFIVIGVAVVIAAVVGFYVLVFGSIYVRAWWEGQPTAHYWP
jgi:hypothetical protein